MSGALCLSAPWPGQARTVWGDHYRFKETYFTVACISRLSSPLLSSSGLARLWTRQPLLEPADA